MKLKVAFVGFRHPHIWGLLEGVRQASQLDLVACCEEDEHTRVELSSSDKVEVTHSDFQKMLKEVEFDVLAIGDCYGKRGQQIIQALGLGKHVLSDKPICTDLQELNQIEELSREKNLCIGCMLDLRYIGNFIKMREVILEGLVGNIHTINITAQHPLLLDTRPTWYLDPMLHGGTINDIGIHAIDLIRWVAGREIRAIGAARVWNAKVPQHPSFKEAAQFMIRLDNDGGVLCDMSYLAPEKSGYSLPQYWRVTCHGDKGLVEASISSDGLMLVLNNDAEPQKLCAPENHIRGDISDLLSDIQGLGLPGCLKTEDVLIASRQTLLIQQVAEQASDQE